MLIKEIKAAVCDASEAEKRTNAGTQNATMKIIVLIIVTGMSVSFMSCRAGKGCPASGRNVGAEKILSGDPKALKEMKKARRFKA
jgi:hypothetical protein